MTKIAILGGGAASLFAAWELVRTDPGAYDITVYQLGWRLGGKGASGRRVVDGSPAPRIEEHGLHLMFGFYENVFRVVREAYAAAYEDSSRWTRFFKPQDCGVAMAHFTNPEQSRWEPWLVPYPQAASGGQPGDPGATVDVSIATILRNAWRWIRALGEDTAEDQHLKVKPLVAPAELAGSELDQLRATIDAFGTVTSPPATILDYWTPADSLIERIGASPPGDGDRTADIQRIDALTEGAWKSISRWLDPGTRALFRFVLAAARGLSVDLLLHGKTDWFELDKYDLGAWIKKHGGDPDAPPVQGLYDAVFASYSQLGAGSILQAAMKAAFLFKGGVIYKMQAGMGDTIFTPLYLALRRRGVKFAFFHRVEQLRLSADLNSIEEIEFERQVVLEGDYDPLIDVEVDLDGPLTLKCWPSEPLWSRLPATERERLRDRPDLENGWTEPAPAERRLTLTRRENHFDRVILGISVAALPDLCPELLRADPAFAHHVTKLAEATTATQAMQLWTIPGRTPRQPRPIIVPNTDPYDTIADMSHLIRAEAWPPHTVGGLHYLCSAIKEPMAPPPRSCAEYPARLRASAVANGHTWLEDRAPILWGTFDPSALYDPANGAGSARYDAQYVHTPSNLSDRYVLAPPDTNAFRLMSNQTRFTNLYLTGDWIKTSLSIGCLECAAMSGIQAARAVALETGAADVPRARGDWIDDVRARAPAAVAAEMRFVAPRIEALAAAPVAPTYRDRDSELLVPPPYGVDCSDLFLFFLRARTDTLQSLCDRELNLGAVRYKPLRGLVVLYGANLRSETHGTSCPAREMGFWVPVVSDEAQTSLWTFSPYVWLDSATSTITGRSVYGYTKQTGDVVVPVEGEPAILSASADALVPGDRGALNVQRAPLIDVRPADPPPTWTRPHGGLVDLPGLIATIATVLGADAPPALEAMLRGIKSLFLKQLPEVAGPRASYQAIVEAAISAQATSVTAARLAPPWRVEVTAYRRPSIVDTLGLEAEPHVAPDLSRRYSVAPFASLWMRFSGTLEPGVVRARIV